MAWKTPTDGSKALPSQVPFSVIALTDPYTNTPRFAIADAHLFGLATAVNNFNRMPDLAITANRWCPVLALLRRCSHPLPTLDPWLPHDVANQPQTRITKTQP